ncbi:hypothetical protein Lal_00049553 [Lupinus albus]|uniref:Uncharacterized protein n=1 Tax=Lupinus albus TaxID=3870 RepID=A0A6A4PN35_LUPAL|nr:hypothetical protein Lalb_Chr12g0205111 [Lupinus albus]KAF1867125.1 hypothetical protein Lal_00049553 [Lupinus albus]
MRIETPTPKEEELEAMRNSIRCCISCILPCGALDVIRIVHSNGKVEEINGTIKAIDVMKANPKHILKKPTSAATSDIGGRGSLPKIVMVPPEAELQRGKIYFLMPLPPPSPPRKKKTELRMRRRKRKEHSERKNNNNNISMSSFVVSDRYLSDILSEKLSMQRDLRRNGRVGVWRPHLESISELPCDV